MRRLTAAICLALLLGPAGTATRSAAQTADPGDLVPARRSVLGADVDYPGNDLRAIFDTTLRSCQAACLADAACQAFTFNSRAGSCFPKSAAGAAQPFAGAISGGIVTAAPAAADRARRRADDLVFLDPADFAAARTLARDLALQRPGAGAGEVALRAVTPGRFHLPAASVEDMYRPDYRARTAAGTVAVSE